MFAKHPQFSDSIITKNLIMSAYKQAGISLNRALAIAAQTVRNSLKADFKVAAERRGYTEVKVSKFENGEQGESKTLEK
ncbi:hypothetical protein OXX79_000232 [Metschnikowia pulcherrima]